jgi:hypothetical protein
MGIRSLPLVLFVAFLGGAVMSQQTGAQFAGALPLWVVGSVIAASVITELGPLLTAIVMMGRVGAAIAAELASMKVSEQIDALVRRWGATRSPSWSCRGSWAGSSSCRRWSSWPRHGYGSRVVRRARGDGRADERRRGVRHALLFPSVVTLVRGDQGRHLRGNDHLHRLLRRAGGAGWCRGCRPYDHAGRGADDVALMILDVLTIPLLKAF